MAVQDKVQTALSTMILSHSGWRGIFAARGGGEGRTGKISAAQQIIAIGAAAAFADYLRGLGNDQPLVLTGCDTRPTGRAIVDAIIPVLSACGCRVHSAGVTAAPEIMAWARSVGNCGFVYVSASHNPIGHNGFKFGLADGGVLPADETAKLTAHFRSLMADPAGIARLEKFIADEPSAAQQEMFTAEPAVWPGYPDYKKEAIDAYSRLSGEVAWNNNNGIAEALKRGIAEKPLGVCCDFNGSARCVSIDREFFNGLGIQFAAINAEPGAIAHRIVPEGESLEPCRAFLEEQHRRDPAFVLGYVPDCDGDRGNLVIWDNNLQQARALEAQEVFALACAAELAQLAWTGALHGGKTAVAVNDPTSLRIDHIAEAFGAAVFRAEVGEANVVGLARKLRESGYTVRILGEGSAGGNITHPSAVRDPLHTVLALAKILSLRSKDGKPGLFELWCNASGQPERYYPDFDLADVIASLPPFATTGAYSPEAVLNVTSADHGALKSRYQKIFLREWEERANELKARYGIHYWEAAAYNGIEEKKGITDFGEAGAGGLKICFFNANNKAIASLWMRGSATEPVFRIMADAPDRRIERELIDWQRRMVMEADNQPVRS
ncbi:MAG: phosphatidylglycerol lysyltransferase [Treponema sp.]|jgi:phosphoglucomutase|nr:phosphatidylglycerol lysyltransferase [Treponema sp.]